MTTLDSNPAPIFASRSQVTAALQRAAERARVTAEQTGTKLIVVTPPQTAQGADKGLNTERHVAPEN